MSKIGLNYTYLSPKHAGGKDQVGLNLLAGFHELDLLEHFVVICFDYSKDVILSIAPEANVITIPCKKVAGSELQRMLRLLSVGTFRLPSLIKKNDINLVFHLSCNNGLKKLPVPSIVIPHDIKAVSHRVLSSVKVPLYKYWLYKIMYYNDFRLADRIIAISDFDKNDICKYYPKFSKKVIKIYNPINIRYIPQKIKVDKPYICALNIQFHHKNTITLIKAFELIKDKISYDLMLIGNVPERVNYLKEYVYAHKLEKRIHFTGFLQEDEMYKMLANCSLYVNPSLYEGFGMTAIEAIIFKVPVLVSKIPANYEVTQGLCRYYEPAESIEALADAILDILNNIPNGQNLEQCKKSVEKVYNYIDISKQYYNLFLSTINKEED
mgnify:CR=1 FL=1